MNTKQLLNLLEIEDLKDLPDAINALLFGDKARRDNIYKELLRLNNYDLSYDWFQSLYEEELAQRKIQKQDFTPKELGVICSMLTEREGTVHEPTAGNGSMIISDWWQRCKKKYPLGLLPISKYGDLLGAIKPISAYFIT